MGTPGCPGSDGAGDRRLIEVSADRNGRPCAVFPTTMKSRVALLPPGAVLASLLALMLAGPASARVTELGDDPPLPKASCPDRCQAIGRVSGYQTGHGGRLNPYRVPAAGTIVAFTIGLGDPGAEQVRFFERLFGPTPQARLSVLRRERKRRYRLLGQSKTFNLRRYFGSSPTFALSRPLRVRAGSIVALTVPTWAPALAVGLGERDTWRASRDSTSCDNMRRRAAHQRRGSLRPYRCVYRTARLLYTVSYVPDPRPASGD